MTLNGSCLGEGQCINYLVDSVTAKCCLGCCSAAVLLFIGKKFTVVDWVACIFMSIGLIFFTLADSSISPSFSLYGKSFHSQIHFNGSGRFCYSKVLFRLLH